MTNAEANQFVSEVLRGLWSRWEPNDEEIRGWTDRLPRFDYGRAQKAVSDLFFHTPNRVTPPAAKVLAVLYNKAYISTTKQDSEPVVIFSIIKEKHLDEVKARFIYEKRYCVSNRRAVPVREEIEHRAERVCRSMNVLYGEKHVILLPNLERKDSNGEDS